MTVQPESDSNRINQDAAYESVSAELLPLVYHELRRLAQRRIQNEAHPQTLTATALVHEAYLRISQGDNNGRWSNQRHFFAAAAEAMRRILIDRARAKKQLKRGGDRERVNLRDSQVVATAQDDELLAIHEVLGILEVDDPDTAELVKMRYFAGMTWEEICAATGIPDRTIRRRWTYARSWLQDRINPE